ncbi:MAG: hypothetical protein ABIR34_06035 [Marmoricola sp.]
MKIWKVLGLAGLAGVAATGVIIARDQRKRSDLTPEEIKDRLHQRLGQGAESWTPPSVSDGQQPDVP